MLLLLGHIDMQSVKRCGQLLHMHGAVCLSRNMSCTKTDEPIEVPFGVWNRGAKGTMC